MKKIGQKYLTRYGIVISQGHHRYAIRPRLYTRKFQAVQKASKAVLPGRSFRCDVIEYKLPIPPNIAQPRMSAAECRSPVRVSHHAVVAVSSGKQRYIARIFDKRDKARGAVAKIINLDSDALVRRIELWISLPPHNKPGGMWLSDLPPRRQKELACSDDCEICEKFRADQAVSKIENADWNDIIGV